MNITYSVELRENYGNYEAYVKALIDGKEYISVNGYEGESKGEVEWLLNSNFFSALNLAINGDSLYFEVANEGLSKEDREDLILGLNETLILIRNNKVRAYSKVTADDYIDIRIYN